MNFEDKIKSFSSRIDSLKDTILTEEATKYVVISHEKQNKRYDFETVDDLYALSDKFEARLSELLQ